MAQNASFWRGRVGPGLWGMRGSYPARAGRVYVSCAVVSAGTHRASPGLACVLQRPYQFSACYGMAWVNPAERTGARKRPVSVSRYARMRALTDVTSEALRRWRQSQGWDVPRMARELRKAARDSGEDVAAHHGLVKMIPQWERGDRAPRERYR